MVGLFLSLVPAKAPQDPRSWSSDQVGIPPTATSTPTFTPSPTPIPCNWARFVEDVNVKDGTVFPPNASFTKTWLIRNVGTCTWNDQYDLVFVEGDRMSAPRAVDFPEGRVRPGESVELSVDLTAPDSEGRHRGYWTLRSDAGRLDCPGTQGDEDGFVILLDRPEIEIDRLENEDALWTQPADTKDGFIRGEYPEFEVEESLLAGPQDCRLTDCFTNYSLNELWVRCGISQRTHAFPYLYTR